MVYRRGIGVALVVVHVVTTTLLTGCTSMKPIRLAQPDAPTFGRVRAGDTVSVVTRDGRESRFVVASVDGESLTSRDGVRYQRADIVQLRRRSTSVMKTSFLAGAIAVGGFFALAAIAFANWDGPVFAAE